MRRFFATIATIACIASALFVSTTYAADKAGPPVKIDAQGVEKPLFGGCYGQVGGQGLFAEGNETLKAFTVGAGCDWQNGALVIGANGRYAFGEADLRALYVGGRIGYSINPSTLFYGHASLLMDGRSPHLNDSVVMGGIGLETYINKQMTVFFEAATDLGKWGDATTLPTVYELHGGIRIRF